MKWEEIYDKSHEIVRRAIDELLDAAQQKQSEEPLVQRLQEAGYLSAKLKSRERYRGREAFRRLLQQQRRRRHLRIVAWSCGIACSLMLCFLLPQLLPSPQPLASAPAADSLFFAQNKAILIRTNGEQVVLNNQPRQLEEEDGSLTTADSTGLQYAPRQGETLPEGENTLLVPRGGIYHLTLSDGTRVWLNSDSKLTYPLAFAGDKREVQLSGEGYFEVTKDARRPFVVATSAGEVKVLGTSFNIKCYADEPAAYTTLVTGKVSFSYSARQATVLTPGQQLVFEKESSRATVRRVNTHLYTGWKDNLLVFHNEPLEEIMRTLSRWYDIHVYFDDEAPKRLTFSGNLDKHTQITTFLKLFEAGADIRFEVKGRDIHVRSLN